MSDPSVLLRELLADMHDSADDESCLFDEGDGSCMACRCFEALGELEDLAAFERVSAYGRGTNRRLKKSAFVVVEWIDNLNEHDIGEAVADNVFARPDGGVTIKAGRIRNSLRKLAQVTNLQRESSA